jgi:hypothetical protein
LHVRDTVIGCIPALLVLALTTADLLVVDLCVVRPNRNVTRNDEYRDRVGCRRDSPIAYMW